MGPGTRLVCYLAQPGKVAVCGGMGPGTRLVCYLAQPGKVAVWLQLLEASLRQRVRSASEQQAVFTMRLELVWLYHRQANKTLLRHVACCLQVRRVCLQLCLYTSDFATVPLIEIPFADLHHVHTGPTDDAAAIAAATAAASADVDVDSGRGESTRARARLRRLFSLQSRLYQACFRARSESEARFCCGLVEGFAAQFSLGDEQQRPVDLGFGVGVGVGVGVGDTCARQSTTKLASPLASGGLEGQLVLGEDGRTMRPVLATFQPGPARLDTLDELGWSEAFQVLSAKLASPWRPAPGRYHLRLVVRQLAPVPDDRPSGLLVRVADRHDVLRWLRLFNPPLERLLRLLDGLLLEIRTRCLTRLLSDASAGLTDRGVPEAAPAELDSLLRRLPTSGPLEPMLAQRRVFPLSRLLRLLG
ncbi:unnamed protein product, partial [Protopolystoma xenopodis]